LEDRYNVRSTIVASQIPPEKWYETIKDPTVADAILDRLIHNSYRIDLDGDSMRRKNANLTEQVKEN
ncbi:MAG: ATP-binding protein, partial [Candidatus Aegiribacteria sp.]|nr:ATP-binding protein [Candidatus Aegiribacteria sp.]